MSLNTILVRIKTPLLWGLHARNSATNKKHNYWETISEMLKKVTVVIKTSSENYCNLHMRLHELSRKNKMSEQSY